MVRYDLKIRLMRLDKNQRHLLEELRKRGYIRLQQPMLSSYITGTITTPQAEAVLKLADEIVKEWEKK